MTSNSITQIKKIKEKLNNQKLSVLVGAGFSLNVSDMFPTWWRLLYDLAKSLYKSEIDDSYNTYISSRKLKSTLKSEQQYYEDKVEEIIEREGYLEIVSEYIKRKGFRESITTYIEQKTPQIVKRKTESVLIGLVANKKKEIVLTNEMLSQHKMLIQLPWNNIYTTNYDTLLEHCVNNSIESELINKIEIIEKEFNNLISYENILNKRIELINRIETANNLEIENQRTIDKSFLAIPINPSESGNVMSLDKLKTREIKISRIKREIEFSLSSIKMQFYDKEANLLELNKGLNECLTVVKDSSELEIKRNKNIIKLHGTLRSDSNAEFGFDGDIHKHYIIAKEDYDTYPQKHEAFTQLMRISLLQESYVLLGFSGVDPNFISWIGWVRDILEKKQSNDTDNYKIYLIDVDNNHIAEDKKLFYKNHRIIRIPIMEDEFINFLESENNKKIVNRKNYKEVFLQLFSYLSRNSSINNAKSTLEILQQDEYRNIWTSIKIHLPQEFNFKTELKKVEDLKKLHNTERFSSLNLAYSNSKDTLLNFANILLEKIKDDDSSSLKLSKLISIALEDSFLTSKVIWDDNEYQEISGRIKDKEVKFIFDKVNLRDSVLVIDEAKFNILSTQISSFNNIGIDIQNYESILFSAFSLNFNTLYDKLDSWNPKHFRILNKAGFLALYDTKSAEKHLEEYCSGFDLQTNQEQFYALKLLRYIGQTISFMPNKELNQKIRNYKNLGLNGFDENIDYILEAFEKKRLKLTPYGEGRFSVSNSWSFSRELSHEQKALQFIQLFIEMGYPMSIGGIYYKSHEEWYLIFKSIYEDYPYPTLFYSLQYSDEKFIRRIAQDFSYSDKLKNNLPDIINKLFDAFEQSRTPIRFKRNILIFASELFIAIPPSVWQKRFYKIWQDLDKTKKLFVERHNNEYYFVIKALPFISDTLILKNVIYDILKNIENNSNCAINYLYSLAKNEKMDQHKTKLLNKKIGAQLNKNIVEIPNVPEQSLFILGNLHQILTEKNKFEIKIKLEQTDFIKIKEVGIWSVVLFFANGDISIQKKIKKAIIQSEKLWHSGIYVKGVSFEPGGFINLQNLRKTDIRSNGLIWTIQEVKLIFDSLIKEFDKIEKVKLKMVNANFKPILEEMYHFLINEKFKLKKNIDYIDAYNEIEKLYFEERKYSTSYEGLLSEDSSTVIWALLEFFTEIYSVKRIKSKQTFLSLLNKIYFQKEPAIEACLSHVSNCFLHFKSNKYFQEFHIQIQQILKRYKEIELVEYDKPFVEKRLINLAKVLTYWKKDDENVAYWMNKCKESNFNNITQNVDE